jgi:hypothetical protein
MSTFEDHLMATQVMKSGAGPELIRPGASEDEPKTDSMVLAVLAASARDGCAAKVTGIWADLTSVVRDADAAVRAGVDTFVVGA